MSRLVGLVHHSISDAGPASRHTLSWSAFADLKKHIREQTSQPDVKITFEDGHRSNLQAATELAELGIRAAVFVIPSFCIDRSDFLKPAELRALHGIVDVGAHGYTHRPLTALDRRVLDRELVDSKIWLAASTSPAPLAARPRPPDAARSAAFWKER